MTDKDRDDTLELEDEELEVEDESVDESDIEQSEEEQEAAQAESPARAAAGSQKLGSVRESHERVKVDNRPSAIFAILCAAALVALLVGAWASGFVPKPSVPALTPLTVPTAAATAAPSASASVTVAP
jgi:hypothetical protein